MSGTTTARLPKVLISGASIAGPALAQLLGRNGFAVTVVEKYLEIRSGGQAVDFKGPTQQRLLEALGIWEAVYSAQTARTEWRIVDAHDNVLGVVPGEFLGGDVEIIRGDLANILYDASKDHAMYVFGDEIVAVDDRGSDGDGVRVTFAHREAETFDLVVGADGVHSAVRRLAFGPEDTGVDASGYYYAVSSARAALGDLETSMPNGQAAAYFYTEPGRSVIFGGQKAPSILVFRATDTDGYDRRSTVAQRAFLGRHFAGMGWRVGPVVDTLCKDEGDENTDFFMDELVRTKLTAFTRGRVALVGDAGYANTLGGFGTGLALMGAYVLAGELAKCGGDYCAAFAAYDDIMRKPTDVAREGTAGPSFLAPPTHLRIKIRNLMFASSWARTAMVWIANRMATDESIPVYDLK